MPAVWRTIGRTLTVGVLALSIYAAGAVYGDDWDPEDFQMIFDSTADTQGAITYNPAFSGVTDNTMPDNILGEGHAYSNFFGGSATPPEAWTQTGPDQFNFKGFKTGLAEDGLSDAFHIWWDVDIKVDPVVSVSLLMNNPTPFEQTFTLTVPLVTGAISPSSLMRGAASGSATDNSGDGGEISAQGVPGYQAWIDAPGNVVQTLLPAGFSQMIDSNSTASIGPVGFGQPGPMVPGPPVTNQIGLTLTFTLSAFDSAIVNGTFEVIPGPGALPMLAVAGLVGVRRRRRA